MSELGAKLVAAWERSWFTSTDARPLGLMRIAVGAVLALQLVERLPFVHEAYSDQGYFTKEAARMFVSDSQWSLLFLVDPPWFVRMLVVFGIVGAFLFALGLWTRVAGLVAFVVVVSLHNRNAIGMYGADMLPRYFLFYLLLMPSDRAFSLTAWRARLAAARAAVRRGEDPRTLPRRAPEIPVWPVRLFQIQVFFIYLLTGINKTYGVDYYEGTTLWYAVVNPVTSRFHPWAYPIYGATYPILQAATIVTLWWEVAMPWMLLVRPLRTIGLWIGVVVHGGIAVLLQIGWWGPLMLVSYLSFFTGRPFERLRVALVRRRRARVPRAERATFEYDTNDAPAAEVAARIATSDGARLVRLVPSRGQATLVVGERRVASRTEAIAVLRRLLRSDGAWVASPLAEG